MDFVAFRFIAANDHPDHDTIARSADRFLKEIEVVVSSGSFCWRASMAC